MSLSEGLNPKLVRMLSPPSEPTLEQQRAKWHAEISQWRKTQCPECGGSATRRFCRCPQQHMLMRCEKGCALPDPHKKNIFMRMRSWLGKQH